MLIRPAREEDVPPLVELARRSWLSAFAQTAPLAVVEHWARANREAAWYARYWPDMLVAEADGGFLGLVQPREAEINGLWVHPARQGTGVGTRLLEAGEQVIAAAGHARAWLTCSGWNERALGFYRSRGYAEVRRERARHAAGVDYEDIIMERSLCQPGGMKG